VKGEGWNSYYHALLDVNAIISHFLIAHSLHSEKSKMK
jgi:hypothetical protein